MLCIPPRLHLITAIAVSTFATLALVGCASHVGPTATQNRVGQDVANTPNNTVTMVDDQGTTTANVGGATDWVHSTTGDTVGFSTGGPMRTALFKDAAGHEISVRSGTDISATGVKMNPATGEFEIASFTTSTSAPLLALGQVQAQYQATIQAMSADQRAVIQSQTEAFLESVKAVSPELFGFLRTLIGVP